MKSLLIAALMFVGTAVASDSALARGRSHSGGHVVHSRRAPVVMHRVVPPFHGVHVYRGR